MVLVGGIEIDAHLSENQDNLLWKFLQERCCSWMSEFTIMTMPDVIEIKVNPI